MIKASNIREPIIKALELYGTGISIAEVGIYKGIHAEVIYQTLKPSKFYMVDTWKDSELFKDMDNIYNSVVNKFGNLSGCNIIRASSFDASILLDSAKEKLDVVYLDSSHVYDNVLDDISYWYPLVKSGGMFCGHDYNKKQYNNLNIKCNVKGAVNDFFKPKGYHINISKNGRDWWIIK